MIKRIKKEKKDEVGQAPVYGNPEYAADEDIYSKEKKIGIRDSDEEGKNTGVSGKALKTGDDLDVPGAELDDQDEQIGEEDEENNYYSLGGDDHDDLEDDKGD